MTGLFGAEAIARKYGEEPPAEWLAIVGRLPSEQLERGMRRLVYSGSKFVPTLPEFVKLCRAVGGDDFDEGQPKPRLLPEPEYSGDAWAITGNRHLLAHIMARAGGDPTRYGPVPVYRQGSAPATHPLAREATAWLVEAKDAWAADMRDIQDGDGLVPVDIQQRVWRDYIGAAEKRIDQRNESLKRAA